MMDARCRNVRRCRWPLLAFALAAVLMLGLTVPTAAQQTASAQVSVSSVDIPQGGEADVDVRLESAPQGGVFSFQGQIAFDPNVISIVDVTFHEECPVFASNVQNGTLRFAATTCEGEGVTSGVLMRIRVRAIGSPGDTQGIDPTFSIFHDEDFESIPTDVSPGTVTIIGGNEPPTVDFETDPDPPIANEPTEFIDRSEDPDGEIVEWEWDFGDGTTSTEPNPTHIYDETGTFTVTLTVTDDAGASTTEEREIAVEEEPISNPTITVFPNPASDRATFRYRLPDGTSSAQLVIYNLEGRRVLSENLNTSRREFVWDLRMANGRNAPNGPYFAFIRAVTPNGARRSGVEVLIIQR